MATSPRIKILEGEQDHNRIKTTPKAHGMPQRPSTLTPHAKKLWIQIVPKLIDMRLIHSIDRTSLVNLCETYAVFQTNLDAYYKQEVGSIQASRCWSVALTALKEFHQQGKCFGLTPLSRNALSVAPETSNEVEQMFN